MPPAPSLYKHSMPPRITEESYRPRVSDRTMVGNSATDTLASFRNPRAPSPSGNGITRREESLALWARDEPERPARARHRGCPIKLGGLDAETKILPAPGRRGSISLDIPLYRTWRQGRRYFSEHRLDRRAQRALMGSLGSRFLNWQKPKARAALPELASSLPGWQRESLWLLAE